MARAARTLAPLLGLAVAGCSLLFAPGRDYPDGGPDGGFDAGPDGGAQPDAGDGGPDAGPDGCPGGQGIERVCDDGIDNDCNGLVDCAEFACAASPACCDGDGMPIPFVGAYNGGQWRVDGAPAFMPEAARVEFGTAPYPQALVLNQCLPLAFGVDLTLDFEVTPDARGDYAALRLTPLDSRAGTEPYLSELTLRVRDDGVVRVERAGAVIAEVDRMAATVPARLTLRPGLDEAQQGSLVADVEAAGQVLVDGVPLLSFESLRGRPECETDGLFLVIEGQGTNVRVSSGLNAEQLACQNPNQFRPDDTSLGTLSDAFAADTGWRSGGLGEPSVSHFVVPPSSERVELWADASRVERADEFLRRVDFTIGATRLQPAWQPRLGPGMSPELVGPSAREPSLAPVLDGSDRLLNLYLLAYAERVAQNGEAHAIVLGTVAGAGTGNVSVSDAVTVLTPAEASCASLRDPALVLLDHQPIPQQVLLLYTCEAPGQDDRIGGARLAYDGASYRVAEVRSDLLTEDIGAYAARGVFSPEAVQVGGGPTTRLRLWFLTRAESGEVSMSTAIGEIPSDAALPVLSPYPGNPTLRATDPLLGGDCSLGCGIESLSATRTLDGGLWPRPSYLLVVAHSRVTATGVDHALVPILQPRPANE